MKPSKVDFEVNLLPIISLLAVCISFLLLTAVWIPLGSLGVKQSVGQESIHSSEAEESLSLWMRFQSDSSVELIIKDKDLQQVGGSETFKLHERSTKSILSKWIAGYIKRYPQLKNAILAPDRDTSLNSMVELMDLVKEHKGINVGVSPI